MFTLPFVNTVLHYLLIALKLRSHDLVPGEKQVMVDVGRRLLLGFVDLHTGLEDGGKIINRTKPGWWLGSKVVIGVLMMKYSDKNSVPNRRLVFCGPHTVPV